MQPTTTRAGRTVPARRAVTTGAAVLGTALAAAAVALLVLREAPGPPGPLALPVALFPLLALAAPASALLLALARAWRRAVLAGALALVCAAAQAPLLVGGAGAAASPAGGARLRVLQLNLSAGRAEAAAVVALVRRDHPDVVALEGLTPSALDRVRAAGMDAVLPSSVVAPGRDGEGEGIWSSTPLTGGRVLHGYSDHLLVARVTAAGPSGSRTPVTVVAVHLLAPVPGPSRTWSRELARLPSTLSPLARGGRRLVVAGDLNATDDAAGVRRLGRAGGPGLVDARARTGAGWVATYPASGPLGLPPLLGLDHVLVPRDAVVTGLRAADAPGSDHRALVADVVLPGHPVGRRPEG